MDENSLVTRFLHGSPNSTGQKCEWSQLYGLKIKKICINLLV